MCISIVLESRYALSTLIVAACVTKMASLWQHERETHHSKAGVLDLLGLKVLHKKHITSLPLPSMHARLSKNT